MQQLRGLAESIEEHARRDGAACSAEADDLLAKIVQAEMLLDEMMMSEWAGKLPSTEQIRVLLLFLRRLQIAREILDIPPL